MNECDRCGQDDPDCQCALRELRIKVDRIEEVLGKLAFVVFELEAAIKALHSAPEESAPQEAEASETEHKDSAPQ